MPQCSDFGNSVPVIGSFFGGAKQPYNDIKNQVSPPTSFNGDTLQGKWSDDDGSDLQSIRPAFAMSYNVIQALRREVDSGIVPLDDINPDSNIKGLRKSDLMGSMAIISFPEVYATLNLTSRSCGRLPYITSNSVNASCYSNTQDTPVTYCGIGDPNPSCESFPLSDASDPIKMRFQSPAGCSSTDSGLSISCNPSDCVVNLYSTNQIPSHCDLSAHPCLSGLAKYENNQPCQHRSTCMYKEFPGEVYKPVYLSPIFKSKLEIWPEGMSLLQSNQISINDFKCETLDAVHFDELKKTGWANTPTQYYNTSGRLQDQQFIHFLKEDTQLEFDNNPTYIQGWLGAKPCWKANPKTSFFVTELILRK